MPYVYAARQTAAGGGWQAAGSMGRCSGHNGVQLARLDMCCVSRGGWDVGVLGRYGSKWSTAPEELRTSGILRGAERRGDLAGNRPGRGVLDKDSLILRKSWL